MSGINGSSKGSSGLLEASLLLKFGQLAAAAVKSLQSCPALCDPIDGSPPGSPVPEILQARTLKNSQNPQKQIPYPYYANTSLRSKSPQKQIDTLNNFNKDLHELPEKSYCQVAWDCLCSFSLLTSKHWYQNQFFSHSNLTISGIFLWFLIEKCAK